MRRTQPGFTLIELLVVISIIGVLIGLLLPAVQAVRAASRRSQCASNMRQLAVAAHNYEGSFGKLPPGLYQNQTPAGTALRYYGQTVFVHILPFVEMNSIYDRWDFTEHANNADSNAINPLTAAKDQGAITAQSIPLYKCPTDQLPSGPIELDYVATGYSVGWFDITSFVAAAGTYSTYFNDAAMQSNGSFFMAGPMADPQDHKYTGAPNPAAKPFLEREAKPAPFSSFTDGQTNTLLFGERYHYDSEFDRILHYGATKWSRYPIRKWGAWGWFGGGNGTTHAFASTQERMNYMTPPTAAGSFLNVNRRMASFGSGHPGGANFVFTDGSAKFISEQIDFVTYQALSTRKQREVVAGDF